ncbi:MAG TPA: signal peptidase I [Candidatus Kapabacteria bacterium]|nr:signal peptidase I [Candidatus Kapabacteria bacterium]
MALAPRKVKKKESFWRSLIYAGLIALVIRSFVVQAFRIPTGSMKNTLLVGDYLFVNELAYGFHTPKYFPFTNFEIPHFGFDYRKVHRGDVVVFEFPGDRDLVIPKEKNINYIKRCIGEPGDTIEVRNKQVFVNGKEFTNTPGMRYNFPPLPLGHPEEGIFPRGNTNWNHDNYGPVRVPKKGDVIALDSKNIDAWSVIIEREGHKVYCANDGSITIDGTPATHYTIQRDYLWMMGDNRDDSADSRYWGFAPVDNVVGNALFIYWSWYNPPNMEGKDPRMEADGYDPEEPQTFHIRWSRLFHGAE